MDHENDFYRTLADIPELPADCYPVIERTIRRRKVTGIVLPALAASIILFIGTFQIVNYIPSRNNTLQPEVASELQIIHDYLNSSDLEGDIELYAVVEGY